MTLDGIGSAPADRAIAALPQLPMAQLWTPRPGDRDALRGRHRQDAVGAARFCGW